MIIVEQSNRTDATTPDHRLDELVVIIHYHMHQGRTMFPYALPERKKQILEIIKTICTSKPADKRDMIDNKALSHIRAIESGMFDSSTTEV